MRGTQKERRTSAIQTDVVGKSDEHTNKGIEENDEK